VLRQVGEIVSETMRTIDYTKVRAKMLSKQEILNAIDKVIDSLSNLARLPQVPPELAEAAALAPMAKEAYGLVKDILESGADPVEVITRMRASSVWLDEAEAEWRKKMNEKFGS
jgi:hypothetical protein